MFVSIFMIYRGEKSGFLIWEDKLQESIFKNGTDQTH